MNTLLKSLCVKTMFTQTVFEILLLEDRSVLTPAQRIAGSETITFSVKNQKYVQPLFLIA